MKKVVLGLAIVIVSLGILSCDLFGKNAGVAGALLPVDGDGHFKQDLEYHQWNGTWKLGKDGSFESVQFTSPTPTENLQTGGLRGTYTYDPDSLTLSVTANEEYNTSAAPDAWSTLTATQSRTMLAELWFTESRFSDVLKQDGASWVHIWRDAGGDSSQPEPNTWSFTNTATYTISAGTDGWSFSEIGTYQEGSNPAEVRGERIKIGNAELFPAGVTFRKGSYINVHAALTTNTWHQWDWGGDAWYPLQSFPLGFEDYAFVCMGDYMVSFNANASREVAIPR